MPDDETDHLSNRLANLDSTQVDLLNGMEVLRSYMSVVCHLLLYIAEKS